MTTGDSHLAPAYDAPLQGDEFVLRYSVDVGPELGPGMNMVQCRIEVRSADGVGTREQNRSQSDADGEPIGLFWTYLDPGLLSQLATDLGAADLAALPPSDAGGPGASVLRLSHETAGQPAQRAEFSSRDVPILEKLEPLLTDLMHVSIALGQQPSAAICVAVRPAANGRFSLVVQNIGVHPIVLGDPRRLGGGEGDWAGVRIAEYPEPIAGLTAPPLVWKRLLLEAPPAEPAPVDPDILIEPGNEAELPTVPWRPAAPGLRHLVQGVLESYGGESTRGELYRVRGAVFSEPLEITPP